MAFLFGGGGGTTSAGSTTEIPQWVQDAGRKQYQTGTELGQIGYTPYYGADVAAFNPLQTASFDSTGMAANAFGMGGGSPTFATDGIQAPQTFAGGVQGYSGMPMYNEALNTLQEQRPYQKQQLEQQFIDPSTGLTPEGRKIQDINSLYNEAFGRNVGLEGVSTYLPLMQQGMTKNELRRLLYDSDEGKALGKSSLGAPIEIGVGGGLLGGAQYVPPALPSGSSGISDVFANTQPVINQTAITQPVINQTVEQIAAGQQTIGDTLTDTDMSTATPSPFDAYGTELEQLNQMYMQELGRPIQDIVALEHYGNQLKNGRDPADIIADLAYSQQGQEFITPAEQAAINAQNLGFGASSVTGNGADDAFQINEMNKLLAANAANRAAGAPNYDMTYDNDFMNVLKGAEEYRQGFVNELSGLLDSLTGNNANSLISSSTTDSSYTNGNNANNFNNVTVTPYGSNLDNDFYSLTQRIDQEDDYKNRFFSPY